ncbi:MAG: hypothetical protein WBL93_13885 [Lutisporaceae bacterium]
MTKYSLKNICLGIGIGLILASMANINITPKKLTKEEIKREAEQYNLIVIDKKDMINKEPEQPKDSLEQQEEQSVVIVIESGTNSEAIAEKLINNKLIGTKQDFLNRLRELNKESKVQIGSFNIPIGSSLDKIIEIITSSPK